MRELKVRKNGNSCLIRWTYQEKNYSLTWGTWGNHVEIIRLEYVGKLIYQDCILNQFDESLNRYKSYLQGIIYSVNTPKPVESVNHSTLSFLLNERQKETFNDADAALIKLIKSYGKKIETKADAKAFMKWLDDRGLKPSSKKRYLDTLKAIRKDIFGEIKIKVPQTPRANPFTKVEVIKILTYIQNNKHYSIYHDFILLLFNTGLRTSEAIGLQWKNVDLVKRQLHIYESLGRHLGSSNHRERKPTKTGKYRVVPINNTAYQMLIKRPQGGMDDLVFTSLRGLPIDDHTLSQRCWRNTLKALNIEHRALYTTRHTFISHCIDCGLTVIEVAAITGHTPKVLLDHYLGRVKHPDLPEL
ncbi:MAG: site-specific integrase [Gloeotrichia echinulata CP02]